MKNRKEYMKEYYKKNKDKILNRSMRYYQNNKEEVKNKRKIYNEEHKEEIKKKSAIYREGRRDIANKNAKKYYEDNKEEIKKKKRERYLKDKEKILAIQKIKKLNKQASSEIIEYTALHKEEIKALKAQWRKEKEKLLQTIYYFEKTKIKRKEMRERNKEC